MYNFFFTKDVGIFTVLCCLTVLGFFGYYSFTDLGFDAQTLLTWEYAAAKGYIPYKDIFYPYGIVQYYFNQSVVAQGVLLLCASFYFFIFFRSLRKITGNVVMSWLLLILLFLFVYKFTGFLAFVRYGSSAAFALLTAEVFSSNMQKIKLQFLYLGISGGLLGSLFLDQGVYSLVVFTGTLGFYLLVNWRQYFFSAHKLRSLFKKILQFVVGFIFGATPLLIYILWNGAQSEFIATIQHLPELALYAKTPFFSSFRKAENLFLYGVMVTTLILLAYKHLVSNKKYLYLEFVQVSLFIVLYIGMYKNIMRLIDKEIIFIAHFLLITILYSFKNELQKLFLQSKLWNIYIVTILVYLLVQPFFTVSFLRTKSFAHENVSQQIDRLAGEQGSHATVVKYLREIPNFNGKVFSYPTDPIFYPLFDQKPPRYVQIYDGSPNTAQQQTIGYISDNDIEYVIYNLSVHAIQDGVPDYLRANTLLRYLIKNYQPRTTIDTFLILEKSENPDLFTHQNTPPELKSELLHPDFGMIPISEGLHKAHALESLPQLGDGTAATISALLSQKNILGSELVVTGDCMDDEAGKITLTSSDGVTTVVSFTCQITEPFILSLNRVPLFFTERKVSNIAYSSNITDLVIHYDNEHVTELW